MATTDFLGNEMAVGDYVVCTVPYVRGLALAKVIKVTPKGVTVEYKIRDTFGPKRHTSSRTGNSFARIHGDDAMLALLMIGENV